MIATFEIHRKTKQSVGHVITSLLSVRTDDTNSSVLFVLCRDSPVVQGNSILALSGLAAVLAKYESNLPADSDGSLGVTQSIFELIYDIYHYTIIVILYGQNQNINLYKQNFKMDLCVKLKLILISCVMIMV